MDLFIVNENRNLLSVVLCIVCIIGLGCEQGYHGKAGVSSTGPGVAAQNVPTVGMDNCSYCHINGVNNWMKGVHANLEAINHITHAPLNLGLDSDGFPYYGFFSDSTCSTCHDQLGDGYLLQAGVTGNLPRPVVGCESCHGGGAFHFGAGDIPYPKPGPEQCGQCHNSFFSDNHLENHPNGRGIVEDFNASAHTGSLNQYIYDPGTLNVKAECARCHTDEGFKRYSGIVPGTVGHDTWKAFFLNEPSLSETSFVQCRTCHNGHTATHEQPETIDASTLAGNAQSAQFNTCTACHQLNNTQGTVLAGNTGIYGGGVLLNGDSFAYHDPHANPYGSSGEIITDNHAAVPGDTRLNTGASAKALIFVNKGDKHSCAVCHNPHSADATINKQWIRSGHGDLTGDPWSHFEWKQMYETSGTGRRACQRCHTSTGFKSFADSLILGTAYDPLADNDFAYLIEGTTTGVDGRGNWIYADHGQMETLYCQACHAALRDPGHTGKITDISHSVKGEIRNPGAFPFQYSSGAMSGNTAFPDASGSNVCIGCHAGQETGQTIENKSGMTNGRFSNSHYLAAAGVLYREIGYEYYTHESMSGGTDYSNVRYYEHDLVGSAAGGSTVAGLTGTNGPCVGCHMTSNPEKHLFSPVSNDAGPARLLSTGCAACHEDPYAMTIEKLEEEKLHFAQALEALGKRLQLSSYPYLGGYPYFPNGDWTKDSAGTSTASDAVGRKNMGAAFNYNMLLHEPGAFAHNRHYTKRLIYDSIDWLDDNTLNQSIPAALPSLASGSTLAGAINYLYGDAAGARP